MINQEGNGQSWFERTEGDQDENIWNGTLLFYTMVFCIQLIRVYSGVHRADHRAETADFEPGIYPWAILHHLWIWGSGRISAAETHLSQSGFIIYMQLPSGHGHGTDYILGDDPAVRQFLVGLQSESVQL